VNRRDGGWVGVSIGYLDYKISVETLESVKLDNICQPKNGCESITEILSLMSSCFEGLVVQF
jgi:hypothetical protein